MACSCNSCGSNNNRFGATSISLGRWKQAATGKKSAVVALDAMVVLSILAVVYC